MHEVGDGEGGGGVALETFDEERAYDGSRGVGTGVGEGRGVGDAEAYEARVAQTHRGYAAEVGGLLGGEAVFGAGGRGC